MKKSETRPVIETPVKVCITRRSKSGRKVLPSASVDETDIEHLAKVKSGTVAKVLDAVAAHVRLGHDVILCNGVRFYGCLDKNMKLIIAAQAINEYRTSIGDVSYVTVKHEPGTHKEYEVSKEQAKDEIECTLGKRRGLVCVSPDMVVTCPNCGTSFRVGKVLTSEK